MTNTSLSRGCSRDSCKHQEPAHQGRGEAAEEGGFKQPFVPGSWRNKRAFHQLFAPCPLSGIRKVALAGGKPLRCTHHVQPQSGLAVAADLAEGQVPMSLYLAWLGLIMSCMGTWSSWGQSEMATPATKAPAGMRAEMTPPSNAGCCHIKNLSPSSSSFQQAFKTSRMCALTGTVIFITGELFCQCCQRHMPQMHYLKKKTL